MTFNFNGDTCSSIFKLRDATQNFFDAMMSNIREMIKYKMTLGLYTDADYSEDMDAYRTYSEAYATASSIKKSGNLRFVEQCGKIMYALSLSLRRPEGPEDDDRAKIQLMMFAYFIYMTTGSFLSPNIRVI